MLRARATPKNTLALPKGSGQFRALMKIALPLFIAVCLAGHAYAQIGETEEACRQNFGVSLPDAGTAPGAEKVLLFEKDGLRVAVGFVAGKAAMVSYKKVKKETDI